MLYRSSFRFIRHKNKQFNFLSSQPNIHPSKYFLRQRVEICFYQYSISTNKLLIDSSFISEILCIVATWSYQSSTPLPLLVEICLTIISAALSDREVNGKANLHDFGWIDVPQTQNFEIPWENSGVKKIVLKFWKFKKMLDG